MCSHCLSSTIFPLSPGVKYLLLKIYSKNIWGHCLYQGFKKNQRKLHYWSIIYYNSTQSLV